MTETVGEGTSVAFSVRVLARQLPPRVSALDVGVFIVGSATELGAWDVDRAVALECVKHSADESEWRIRVAFAAAETPIAYKYVVKRRVTLELLSWEAIPGDRTATVAGSINVARGKPSTQSSTHVSPSMPFPGPRVAALGNDGSRNGFREWRCARTEKEANPWWQVDLGSEHAVSSVQLWKAMTYHEHPKHPDGRPPVNSSAATGSPAPPLWVLISTKPFTGSASVADARADPDIVARQLVLGHGSRVSGARFGVGEDVVGRYVRLQHESVSPAGSVLQFAEVEVFARPNGPADPLDREQRDGFYGVESALDGDITERIDSEWLMPSSSLAEVRFWIGSFNSAAPAVQRLTGGLPNERDTVSIELRYDQRAELDSTTSSVEDGVTPASDSGWRSVPVDFRSSELLDKESTELLGALEASTSRPLDLSSYLNSKSEPSHLANSGSQQGSWLRQLEWLNGVDPECVQKLVQKVETLTFASGGVIMNYGERRRAVFFLRDGEVELLGPHTSLGAKAIGTVKKHSVFNELSLFGGHPQQAAEFRAASSQVECETLDFASLVEVLGAETVASIREGLIRQASGSGVTPADSGAKEARSVHYTDATRAQVFRTKVPLSVVGGGSASPAALSHRFEFDVFEYAKESAQRGAKIGSARLLPSQFSANGEGYLTLPIASSIGNDVVGQLTLTFLVIKPFVHAKNTVSSVWRSYWRPRAPLNVGHRGMGRSFHQVAGYRHALTRENTLASLILAGRSGADFVEFDVQLTKDRVPVIYHDFVLKAGLEDKHAWVHGARAEPYEIGIHEMTLRQLQRSQTAPTSNKKSESLLQQRVRKHWTRVVGDKSAGKQLALSRSALSSSSNGARALGGDDDEVEVDEEHLVEFFPKFEDLLKHVPAEVGLNVEIKYPDNVWRTAMRHSPPFAINEYVDAILKCVFEYAGENRRVFFSCFDPNLCVLLRAKQAKYPVLFLTYGSILPHAFDARMTLQFAVNFANMEKLGGIVSNSEAFLANPELVQVVKRVAFDRSKSAASGTGLVAAAAGTARVLLTWGDKNTSHDCVQLQKQHAMDGVISDNIGDLVRQDRKLSVSQ